MADLLDEMRSNPQGDWTIKDVERVCRENGLSRSAAVRRLVELGLKAKK
jgi:hypothetical protein